MKLLFRVLGGFCALLFLGGALVKTYAAITTDVMQLNGSDRFIGALVGQYIFGIAFLLYAIQGRGDSASRFESNDEGPAPLPTGGEGRPRF